MLRRRFLQAALLVLATGMVLGCTSTVRVPVSVTDPVVVYLLVDDMHRGLWFPRKNGGFVEFGFGDWGWYAANQDKWYNVFDTILWPTQGGVGRRVSHARDGASLKREFHWMVFCELRVERGAMVALRGALERLFDQHRDEQVFNDRYGMTFVPVDASYWLCHNCNDELAEWLRRLDCEVSWVPIRLGLELE